jgi:hypothetical protein
VGVDGHATVLEISFQQVRAIPKVGFELEPVGRHLAQKIDFLADNAVFSAAHGV